MARSTYSFEESRRPSHDGSLRCLLCGNTAPGADHEWCAASESLVCDSCCLSLLQGDPHRLFSIAANAGRIVTPDRLFEACAGCDRAHRQAAERLLGESPDEDDDVPIC